ISLRKDDRVVAMAPLDLNGGLLLTVTERGYGKRTAAEEDRLQNRGGMGIITVKVTAKTGDVIAVKQVAESDGLVLITQEGKILRTQVAPVRVVGGGAMGVKMMDLEEEDRLIAAAAVPEREEEAAEEAMGAPIA